MSMERMNSNQFFLRKKKFTRSTSKNKSKLQTTGSSERFLSTKVESYKGFRKKDSYKKSEEDANTSLCKIMKSSRTSSDNERKPLKKYGSQTSISSNTSFRRKSLKVLPKIQS